MTEPVKEPEGLRFRAGGGFGLPSLKRDVDVAPYGTYYRQTEVFVQVERRKPNAFLTLFSRDWPIYLNAGLGQSDISGSYQNLGSNRQLYYASVGGRFYFPDPMFIEGAVGLGGSKNQLDFGKGFPVETAWSANFLARGGLGVEHCVAETICFSAAAYWHLDASFLGGTSYVNQGPVFMIMAGGRRDTVVYDTRIVDIYKDEITRLEDRNTDVAKKCDEAIDILKTEVDKKKEEVEHCRESAAADCAEALKPSEPSAKKNPRSNQDAEKRALLSSLYIYFANDNPDQTLQFNWFPTGNEGSGRKRVLSAPDGCLSHTELDVFIRAVTFLMNRKDLKIVIRVHGSANDTGDDQERNDRLAAARSQFVIDYMTKKQVSVPTGIKAVLGERSGSARLASLRGGRKGFQICGALDSQGKFGYVLEPDLQYLEIVNENSSAGFVRDKTDFTGRATDPSDPKYRYARIDADIYRNGKLLTGDEREQVVRLLDTKAEQKKEKADVRMR